MGLYQQPNDWTCGPFALKHALVALGRLADEDTIGRVAEPHWWAGTDEVQLARAARHFECDFPLVRRTNPESAYESLARYLTRSLPVVLCVDGWGHWVTVVSHEKRRFVVLDSNEAPVVQVMTWGQLRLRWAYEQERAADLYDLHVVKPRHRMPARAAFSVERAQFLRRPENAHLATHWDEYLGDLMEICRPRSDCRGESISMAEFLRRNQGMLVARVLYWHGSLVKSSVSRLLRSFRFVAETYGLVIPASAARQALVDLAMLLAFWAAASAGIGEMYSQIRGNDLAGRRRHRRRAR